MRDERVELLDQDVASYGVLHSRSADDESGVRLEELIRLGYTLIDSGVGSTGLGRLKTKLADVYARQAEAIESVSLDASKDADVARALLAYEECFLELATNSALLAFSRQVLGESFVLLQQNGLINRPSRGNYQLRWHRDLPFQHWVASKPIAIAALFCLDEFSATTGGTYVLPGSHMYEEFPSEAFVRDHQEVITAPPGTFIVLNAMTFHRAGKNTSNSVRRAVNQLIGLPFLAQQIDLPGMLAGAHADDPFLSAYLGYKWRPAANVEAWRSGRVRSS